MKGFYLKRLSVVGPDLPVATIKFEPGGNLVTGASDSGKSYIFSALGYALGRSIEPKKINEASGYDLFLLEITDFGTGSTYTLGRNLGQNTIRIKSGTTDEFADGPLLHEYRIKADPQSQSSLAFFLLGFAGLSGKRLLKNKREGKTQNLTYSNFQQFSFINESDIIKLGSPFYFIDGSSNYIVNQSFVSLLLTGNDFSNIRVEEIQRLENTKIYNQIEYIEIKLRGYSKEREDINKTYEQLDEKIKQWPVLEDLKSRLETQVSNAERLLRAKNDLISELENLVQDVTYDKELNNRFSILLKQYTSDLERVDFILEADELSSQLNSQVCPICSSSIDENTFEHIAEIENFRKATRIEYSAILSKIEDLKKAKDEIQTRLQGKSNRISFLEKEISALHREIETAISPEIEAINFDLGSSFRREKLKNQLDFIDKEIDKLLLDQAELEGRIGAREGQEQTTIVPYESLLELSKYIQKRLASWNYEPNLKVSFNPSYKEFDILISGKPRGSFGKGKRAISYAACVLGVMDYCNDKGMNFNNLIVFDSPLTTFQGQISNSGGDEIEKQVEESFFKDLASTPEDRQIIVFDNKRPGAGISEKLNMIVFDGVLGSPNKGFFPARA